MSIRKFREDERYRKRWREHYRSLLIPAVPREYHNYVDEYLNFLEKNIDTLAEENPFTTNRLVAVSDDVNYRESKKNAFLTWLAMRGVIPPHRLYVSKLTPPSMKMLAKSFIAWKNLFTNATKKKRNGSYI
jgi:predicted AlkP superfamily phosphohydrolase/phosphomutase